MNMPKIIVTVLGALAFAINIPGESLAQGGQTGRQIPQPEGGIATVIGVDQPENCLGIRSGPGNFYDVIGCANMGDQLNVTGVWASNDWAQLADNSWVYGPQIQTDLRPPPAAYSRSPSYVVSEAVTPDYYDWAYLPDYGYDTYWYGGIPIFFYNIGVWQRFHPSWWHRGHQASWWHRGHQAWWWQDGHHGRRAWDHTAFNNYVRAGANRRFANRSNISPLNRAGTPRSFATNRSNISSANVNRFNTNRFRSGSTNAFRSRTFSTPNTFRSGPANAFRSRSFSSPQTFRSGSFGGRQFSGLARSGGFSSARFGGGGGGRMGGGHR